MAQKRWIGAADAVAQVTTITFSTYSASETYTITINGKSISFTATTGTNTDIWSGLQAAWEDSSVPEHVEAVATVDSGVVLTSRTAGQPFTVSASATTGTATVTTSTAATGPNHFDNADNWEGGVAPIAADDLLFADSSVDVLYNIEPGLAFGVITVEQSYTGRIGLSRVSDSGYQEYRARYLKLAATASIEIGSGSGQGSNRIFIDANAQVVDLDVYSSGQGDGQGKPVQVKNPAATSDLSVYGGRVSFEGSGGASTLNAIARQNTSVAPDVNVDSGLSVGDMTVAGNNTELLLEGSASSLTASDGAEVSIAGDATCPIVKTSSNSQVFWDSTADLTNKLFVYQGGYASFARRKEDRTVADCELHSGGTLLDPHRTVTWTAGVTLVGLLGDVTLDAGRNLTIHFTVPSTGWEVFDSENADLDLTSTVTVLTHTPDPTGMRRCQGIIALGDGTDDLDGSGGDFEITVLIGGATYNGGPQSVTIGTESRTIIQTTEFSVPANSEVVIRVRSPNAADTNVDVTAYLISED